MSPAQPRGTREEIIQQIEQVAAAWMEFRGYDWWATIPRQPRELFKALLEASK